MNARPYAQLSAFAVLRKPSFVLLWSAQLISTIGSTLTLVAASILVYRQTGTALSVGLMLIMTTLPSLCIGLFAGVIVDRWNRKRIMIAADLMRALLIGLIPLLLPLGTAYLYLMVLLANTIGQFFNPAHASVLPETATDDELAAANALMAVSTFGAPALGFAVGGLIAARFSIAWALYADAVTFLLSAACIARIRIAPLHPRGATRLSTVLHDLRDGLRTVVDTPSLRSLFLIYLPVFVSISLFNTLVLPFAERALDATAFDYGLLTAVEAVSFTAGCLAMARFASLMKSGRWIGVSLVGMGLAGSLMSQAPSVLWAGVLIAVLGCVNAPSSVARQLVLQRETPRQLRGRVNSAFFVARDSMFVVGMAAAGLADWFDVRGLLLACWLVIVGCGLLTFALPGLEPTAASTPRARRRLLYSWRVARPVPTTGNDG